MPPSIEMNFSSTLFNKSIKQCVWVLEVWWCWSFCEFWKQMIISNQVTDNSFMYVSNLSYLFNWSKIRDVWFWGLGLEIWMFHYDLNWRVWSWLRLNAGGRPNTCKSSANVSSEIIRAADGWVTRGNLPSSGGQPVETLANTAYVLWEKGGLYL